MSRKKKKTAKEVRLERRSLAREYGVKVPAAMVPKLIRAGESDARYQLACYAAAMSDPTLLVVCEACSYVQDYRPLPWTRKQEAEILAGEGVRMMPCKGPLGDGGCEGEICVTPDHWKEAA